jgi:hypothetical protein
MTDTQLLADNDEPFVHTKPMSPFAAGLFRLGLSQMREVQAEVRGTPEAIAEARARTKAAILRARQIVEREG